MNHINVLLKLLIALCWFFSNQVFANTTLYELTDHEGRTHFIFGTFHSDDIELLRLMQIY